MSSPRDFSCDRRDQFSASAIENVRFAGSRCASSLHNAARELSSDWSINLRSLPERMVREGYGRRVRGTIAPMAIVLQDMSLARVVAGRPGRHHRSISGSWPLRLP